MKSFTDVGGFDSLHWEDQEKVKKKVGGGVDNGAVPAAAASGVSDDLLVEYAKSSRSKCKNCKEQIDKVKDFYLIYLLIAVHTNCPRGKNNH